MDITEAYAKSIAKVYGGHVAYPNNTLGKWVGNEFVIKQSVQLKDLRTVWLEEADPSQIDTRYYNIDGSKKIN